MPAALVVQHTDSEDPGRLGEWLPAAGLDLTVVKPYAGEALPERVGPATSGHAALVVMGGPQSAYDVDGQPSAPWLPQVKALLRAAVADGVPVLGVCLGAQLLAEACGGTVRRGERGPEVGAGLVAKRDAAAADPLFAQVPFTPDVVQWHWDEIATLPPGALLLAAGTRYPHQAFRVGDRAWGVQFHLETPPEMVRRWADADADAVRRAGLDPDEVYAGAVAVLDDVAACWRPVATRFAEVALGRVPRELPLLDLGAR